MDNLRQLKEKLKDKSIVAVDSYFEMGGNSPYLMNFRPYVDVCDELMARCNKSNYTALTVTFKSQLRDNLEEDILQRQLYILLIMMEGVREFTLIPDIDRSGNFHYHGVIRVRTANIPKIKRNITRNIGYCKFEYISDPEGWYKYCMKEEGFKSKEHKDPLEKPIYNDTEKVKLLVSSNGRFKPDKE